MRIFKYALIGVALDCDHTVQMPQGAKVLCVQVQFDNACIWAAVDETAPQTDHKFYIASTGGELSRVFDPVSGQRKSGATYIGTFQLMGGRLVYHVFDLGAAS